MEFTLELYLYNRFKLLQYDDENRVIVSAIASYSIEFIIFFI